jgi:sugar/nucleoside kinase (ribokinase family)
MNTLGVGDANTDLTAQLSRFPTEGDDSPVTQLVWGSGGSATNVAAGLALLGSSVRLLARVGVDPAAVMALRVARRAGVDCAFVQEDPAISTGLCYAAISPQGERTFFSFRGANVALAPPPPTIFADSAWMHIAGHALLEGEQRRTALQLFDDARRLGIPVSLDLCLPTLRAHLKTLRPALRRLHILFANEREIELLAGIADPLAALAALRPILPAITVAKIGAQGCLLADTDGIRNFPAFPVDAVDTNGCGDAFVAAFLSARLHGEPADTCARIGNAAGALTAMRHGAADALPTHAEVIAMMEKNHDSRLETTPRFAPDR